MFWYIIQTRSCQTNWQQQFLFFASIMLTLDELDPELDGGEDDDDGGDDDDDGGGDKDGGRCGEGSGDVVDSPERSGMY